MEHADQITRELANIVGPEWVSSDPEIVYAYSRDGNLYPDNLSSVIRPPFYAVLPGTQEELQKVMVVARKYQAPVTIQATGLNICGMSVPNRGGIQLDLKRLDKVLTVDEENGTATIEPYVTIARLSCELQKKRMYIPVPGCPSTASIISNLCVGMGLKVTNRVGRQDNSIVGMKILLPNGNFMKIGSGADPMIPKDFWPHGPGPDMHLLPVWTAGTTGIITELTVKCWLMGEHFKEMWVAYEDADAAFSAFVEVSRLEIAKGLNLYAGNKYTSYFCDTRESMERMMRANPEFQMIISLDGSKRRIAYEEGLIRQVAEKTGGKVIADFFEPYESFVQSHAGMSGSFYSEYSMKYWGSRGTNWTTAGFPLAEKNCDQYKAYSQAVMDDSEYGDPDFGHGEYWRSVIAYPFVGGHYYLQENGIDTHPGDPKWQDLTKRLAPTFPRYGMMRGVLLPPYNKAPRTGWPPFTTPLYSIARQIARRLDPEGYISEGQLKE